MNRRSFLKSANAAGLALALPSTILATEEEKAATAASNPKTILLKDYRPRSIYKVPVTQVDKAKFSIIDMHSHPEPKTDAEINTWIKNMDEVGVEKSMVLTMARGSHSTRSTRSTASILTASKSGADLIFPHTNRRNSPRLQRKNSNAATAPVRKVSAKFTTKGRGCARENPPHPAFIPTIRVSMQSGKKQPNSTCRSACTSPIPSGCTNQWTNTMTA